MAGGTDPGKAGAHDQHVVMLECHVVLASSTSSGCHRRKLITRAS
jgi:hypothetical protein